jgi:hypothetical protein
VATLVELIAALEETESAAGSKATSIRLPEALHRAVGLATELGMDSSFTAATSRALTDRLHDFVRRLALAEHFREFPADRPALAAVAHRRVAGTDHPGTSRPELVDEVAAWVEERRPDWWLTGAIDDAVDEILGAVEMLAAGVGDAKRRSA